MYLIQASVVLIQCGVVFPLAVWCHCELTVFTGCFILCCPGEQELRNFNYSVCLCLSWKKNDNKADSDFENR